MVLVADVGGAPIGRVEPGTHRGTAEFRFTVLSPAAGEMVAGVMDASGYLPEVVASAWTIYFGAEDTDAAVANVVELGGTVVEPPEDTPYGRMARVADPFGTNFKLVAANDQMPATYAAQRMGTER